MSIDLQHSFTIYLTAKHHQIAEKFAHEQTSKFKAKQVYLNTLAVLAINEFLPEINYQGNLRESASFNPVINCLYNTGNLMVADIDVNLECRPILPEESAIIVPQEVIETADFYIGVQFQESLDKVKLLGFYPATKLDTSQPLITIPIEELTPIEDLIDELFAIEEYIDSLDENTVADVNEKLDDMPLAAIKLQLEKIYRDFNVDTKRYAEGVSFIRSQLVDDESSLSTELEDLVKNLFKPIEAYWEENEPGKSPINIGTQIGNAVVKLGDIIKGIRTPGYLYREEAIAQQLIPATAFLGDTEDQKITFNPINLAQEQILLSLQLETNNTNKINIKIIVKNVKENEPLPSELELILEDEKETITRKIKQQKHQDRFDITFSKNYGESFTLRLLLGDESFQEQFTIDLLRN
ncbi:MAG: DUF1822 family protein [Gomphosphaeria aponina SAG 52.96 = DSM 107014]|uniref:DUF1822 family protein n=1 Tax=Gomphosphaeria aponina SAG 52.96 = DSM 107014 TaxID=1521640 RepID=A0A941JUI4_9CHRO|nr:DUF1822 family protein [Gomphosphaeria aponina SAG 52.96 = DSM 107014]